MCTSQHRVTALEPLATYPLPLLFSSIYIYCPCWTSCTGCPNKHYYMKVPCTVNFSHLQLIYCALVYLFHACTGQVTCSIYHPRAISVCYKQGNYTWWVTQAVLTATKMKKEIDSFVVQRKKRPVIAWSEICVS